MKLFNKLIFTMLMLQLVGCSADLDDYRGAEPRFDIKTYFDGNVTAWGMVQDYSSKVTRRFCVDLQGSWEGNKGLLAEQFYFDDGEVSFRNWQLTKLNNGEYEGSAEDVVGIAKGRQQGFAFQWQYNLTVAINGTEYEFFLDDWMYQLDEHRVFNRTEMKKLGVAVAEITLFFDKQTPLKRCGR